VSSLATASNPADEPREIDLNFPNSVLENILKMYAELTGRTILRPGNLPANQTITLVSNGKLTRTEAIQAINSVLTLNGISLIPEGERFVKAIQSATVLTEGAAFSKLNPDQLPEAGEFVTQVVQLTNALPSEVQPTLAPFAKIQNGIVPIDSSMTLVLRDYAPNIKRMIEIINKVDVVPQVDYKLEVIPIKFGKVEDIYNVMSGLIGGSGGASGASTRTAQGSTSMRTRGSSTRRTGATSRGGLQRPGQTGQLGAQTGQPGQASSFQQRLAQIVNRAASGGDLQVLEDARIIPDDRANSLVVYANKQDMGVITNIVGKLDVMLAQVLIESAIIDVSLNNNLIFGVSMVQKPKTRDNVTGAGAVNNGQSLFDAINTNLTTAWPGGFSYFMNFRGDLDMAINALASSGSVTVLQKPRIQTTHAVPASFFNGRTVPYITGSYYGGSGYGNSSQYQQLEVGIGLEVTPFITPDKLVLMEVNQTIDEISGTTKIDNNDVPLTSSRTASSTVSVRDGETIFLGGFIRSSKEKTRSGVPFLKDIPLLGALFRSDKKTTDRSELVVLIRPTVLLTPEDASNAVEIEKQNLPGVRLAEREFKDSEEIVNRAAEKELRKKDELRDNARSKKSKKSAQPESSP
jgi:general secretion pathway protein D